MRGYVATLTSISAPCMCVASAPDAALHNDPAGTPQPIVCCSAMNRLRLELPLSGSAVRHSAEPGAIDPSLPTPPEAPASQAPRLLAGQIGLGCQGLLA